MRPHGARHPQGGRPGDDADGRRRLCLARTGRRRCAPSRCLPARTSISSRRRCRSDDVEGYAKLCHASPVKIALGEWQNTRFEFLEFMNAKAVDVVQPDVGRVGGLTEAKRVAMHARDRGLVVVPHCWKSAIGIAASAHLAAVAPTCTYIEFLPRELADSALRRDLCSVELPVVDGRIPLPTAPGLGVTLNEEALHRFRV